MDPKEEAVSWWAYNKCVSGTEGVIRADVPPCAIINVQYYSNFLHNDVHK
jgi:hypothetical protein